MCCIPGESLIAVFIDFENLAMGAQVTKSGREFHGQGIGLVDIPQSRMSGKNSADIHVVVDAIDLCYSKDHIDTFALLSGDSDFSLLRLRNCAELACHVAWVATRTGRLLFLRSSAQKEGVLPISQQSLYVLASLAYHDYEGVALHDEERPRLAADLGEAVFPMLRNHGLLTVGGSRAGPPARRVVCATSECSPRRS